MRIKLSKVQSALSCKLQCIYSFRSPGLIYIRTQSWQKTGGQDAAFWGLNAGFWCMDPGAWTLFGFIETYSTQFRLLEL